ncbi:glycosyltransferase family 4 protein [Phocaeicola paurosaccharolyticus]|uniref:glycosyltransferase family 4 protein n=1 Tax=Phocaeicola paurosaccharolyticus TaxID=732242 RepID=UPI00046A44F6|nr:glycosyltransferase family 4 protein [Phocaeicola paurosaccharolyticus]
MKIVYIIGGIYGPNGMSYILSQKVNYLADNTDYKIYVVLTEQEGMPLYYRLSDKVELVNFDINFDELDTMPLLKKVYHFSKKQCIYKRRLTNYLCNLRPDITVSAMRREINFINNVPDGSKKVGELHFNKSNYREFNKSFLPSFVNQFITRLWREKLIHEIKRLDQFVVLSHEDLEAWTELDNVIVIPNSIPYFPSSSSTCKGHKVIAVGRYTYQKGFDMLIDAWRIVSQRHPYWKLNIYGSGDNEIYQSLADSKQVGDSIFCHSAVNNIYEKYLESSIFVLSSRYEGFGLVLAEAMSCGIPVVTFTCPCGPKDIVTDKVDGIWVEPNNVNDLADKICYLVEHEDERIKMGEEAAKSSKRYCQNIIMKQWIDLFDGLI